MKGKKINPRLRTGEFTKLIMTGNAQDVKDFIANRDGYEILALDEYGRDSLYDAIFAGNLDIVKDLIDYGLDPNLVDSSTGAGALHFASAEGHYDIVEYLINVQGLKVNQLDKQYHSPLYYALLLMIKKGKKGEIYINQENLKIAKLLVASGAKFQKNLHSLPFEMGVLEAELVRYFHYGLMEEKNRWNCINFLKEDMAAYDGKEYKDIEEIKKDIYTTPDFQDKKKLLPLALGWKIKDWDWKLVRDKFNKGSPKLLKKSEIKPVVIDLAKVSPFLINLGDTLKEEYMIMDNIFSSVMARYEEDACRVVFIEPIDRGFLPVYKRDGRFIINSVDNMADAIETIKALVVETESSKKLSKKALAEKLPMVCIINDITEILEHEKSIEKDMQYLMMNGPKAKIYFIMFVRDSNKRKLSSFMSADILSHMLFHTKATKNHINNFRTSCMEKLGSGEALITVYSEVGLGHIKIK